VEVHQVVAMLVFNLVKKKARNKFNHSILVKEYCHHLRLHQKSQIIKLTKMSIKLRVYLMNTVVRKDQVSKQNLVLVVEVTNH
jgi:hypothetical protein